MNHYSHHYYLAILFQYNMYADMHVQKFIWASETKFHHAGFGVQSYSLPFEEFL